ncbi:nitrate transporter [Ktedonobacter sp. SOSP1-52]|uniref:nitrate/nitrite transporter n=1 Tax=Ktedonobacter sp. SOSP1-52 TaxID=2778366 RepID=UPI0019157C34|nr:MFS transporter [Ktedonobacter sp. SOSP1-52]GHO71034.1 nitrate transporter [Ktedonobacter sp. SOSP1-52]
MPFLSTKGSARPGSISTVIASFLHFDTCFTIWVLLGSLSVFIAPELKLNAAQQGLMVALPTLSGSLIRLPAGLLSDRYSGKWIGIGLLTFLFLPLLLGWLLPVSFPEVLCIGLMLGVAGSSFAVALPLASRWYPPTQQGLVMGIAAAGNIGTVIANATAPSLARAYGWHAVLGLAMIPLVLVLLAFVLLAKESPTRPEAAPIASYVRALGTADMWWFCLLYSVTFGGFVGLGTFLPQFYHNQFGLPGVEAGYWAAGAAFTGSTLRPLGGYIADRLGGVRVLSILLLLIAGTYALASLLLPIGFTGALFIVGIAFMGMGNGAVFQLVPQRFQRTIGIATGLVGALGGIGGFVLPFLLGSIKQTSGSYAAGWIILSIFAFVVLAVLRLLAALRASWRSSWAAEAEGTEIYPQASRA